MCFILGTNDARLGSVTKGPQKIGVVYMCKAFGEECTLLKHPKYELITEQFYTPLGLWKKEKASNRLHICFTT